MKNSKKLIPICCLLLIAVVFSNSLFFKSNAVETTPKDFISVSKTAHWTNEEKTTLDIEIGQVRKSGTSYAPNILFVGTLCNAHSLSMDTVYTALAATAEYGNVDCYLFGNGWSAGTVERLYHGSINKLTLKRSDYSSEALYEKAKISAIKNTSVTFQENESSKTSTTTYGAISLIHGQHASVYDFAELFANLKKNNKKYDYIVMEFDGLRLGHTDYDRTKADIANLTSASEWIAEYYKDGKVAWIISPKTDTSDGAPSTYGANKYMFNEYFFDNTQGYYTDTTPVRDCMWLLSPEDIDATEKSSGTISGKLSAQTNFIARATDTSDNGIWVTYDNAENVKIFLEKRFAVHYLTIEDIVIPGFDVTGVKAKYTTDDGKTWKDIPGNASSTSSDYGKFTYEVGTKNATGTKVSGKINLRKVFPNYQISDSHNIKMVISAKLTVTDEESSSYIFKDTNNYQVDTNVGNAVITNIDNSLTLVSEKESPSLERLHDYNITYVLNGGKVSTDNPVKYNVKTETFTLTNPTRDGYTFKGWTGGVVTSGVVSEDVKDSTSVSVVKGSKGDRKYTANWEPVADLSTTKDVKKVGGSSSVSGIKQNAGAKLTYSVTVTNNHAEEPATVVVEDTVPAGLTVDTTSISNSGSYDKSTGKIKWTDVTIPAATSTNKTAGTNKIVLTFNVTVPDTLSSETEYTNKAYVTKAYGKDYTGTGSENNKPGTVKFTAVPKVKIKVEKKWSDTWASHSSGSVYVNLYAGSNLVEKITLNATTQSVEKSLNALDDSGKTIIYSVSEMTSGATDATKIAENGKNGDYKVNYSTATNSGVTTYTITNNYVIKPSDLKIDKTAANTFKAGGEYSYTITVKNTRQYETAQNIIVEDVINSALTDNGTALSATAKTAGEELSISDKTYTWKVKTLAPGATATLVIKVKAPSEATAARYKNQAKIKFLDGVSVPSNEGKSPLVKSDLRSYFVKKTWYNADGSVVTDTSKMPSVTVVLLKNGTECARTTLKYDASKPNNGWSYKFEELALFGSDGTTPAVYTVKEIEISDFSTVIIPEESSKSTKYGYTAAEIKNTKYAVVTYHIVGDKPIGTKCPDTEKKSVGSAYTSSTDYGSCAGYVFSGWYTSDGFESKNKYTDGTKLTGNLDLYGKWEYKVSIGKTVSPSSNVKGGDTVTYTITLKNASNQKVTGISVTDVLDSNLTYVASSGTAGAVYTATTRTLSWLNVSINANSSTTLVFNATVNSTITSATEIKNKASFKHGDKEIESSLVKFNADPKPLPVKYHYVGNVPSGAETQLPTNDINVNYGATYTAIADPEVSGYVFYGWYTDETCNTEFTDGTTVTDQLDLYGKWEYKVSIVKTVSPSSDVKGGDVVTYTITIKNDTDKKVSGISVTDVLDSNLTYVAGSGTEGAVYTATTRTLSWSDVSVDANSSTTLAFNATVSSSITSATEIKNTASFKHGDKEIDSSPVTFNACPVSVPIRYQYVGNVPSGAETQIPADDISVDYGANYTAIEDPEVSGYVFCGWYIDEACNIKFTDGTALTSDLVLYGKWVEVKPSPKTGDDSNVGVFGWLFVLSALGIGTLLVAKNKRFFRKEK